MRPFIWRVLFFPFTEVFHKQLYLQIHGLLLLIIFRRKFGAQIQKILIYMCMGKKFHSFYAFELIIHFLAEEDFLNMHSDILLNVTPGIWIV